MSSPASRPSPAAVGRPRDPDKDVAVLEAASELLVEVGYQGTTVVAIARRAGVGAPTIYRRWATREALIEDAAFGRPAPAPLPEPTGDLFADLRAWTLTFLDFLANPVSRAALPGLLSAFHRDEEIYERLVLRSETEVRAQLAQLLAAAATTDDLATRAETVFDVLVATTFTRAMTRGMIDADAFCDRTAAALTTLARGDR